MTFEFDPQKYIEASDHQQRWGEGLIKELDLRGNESILDLGCGDGRLTALLARQVPEGTVVGIDASQKMTAAARERHHQQTNLSFRTLDINRLCGKNEFDIIFSNATLHWVHDHQKLYANVRRALKPQGIVRFNFAGDGNCIHLIHILQQIMKEPDFTPVFKHFTWPWNMPTIEDTTQFVKEAGFLQVRVWSENGDTCFPEPKPLIGWIDQPSLVPFLKAIEDTQQKQLFRQHVIEHMLKQTHQPNGTFIEVFCRINVFAVKEQ